MRVGEVAALLLGARRIVVLTGAGVSVGAGIPDFRSPGGLYNTLRPELLTATEEQRDAMVEEKTMVVDWALFSQNQFPYLEVRKPFIIGTAEQQWQATLAHWFLRVLHNKSKLRRLYTQNIDGLDYQLGLPNEVVISVHGSIGKVSCEGCQAPYDTQQFCQDLRTNIKDIYGQDPSAPQTSTPIPCPTCHKNLLKPTTVLYGRSMPSEFYDAVQDDFPNEVDLLVVIGTSLAVFPANTLVVRVGPGCPVVVINRERVGEDLGLNFDSSKHIFLQGDADEVCLALARATGWEEDLAQYQDKMAPNGVVLLRTPARPEAEETSDQEQSKPRNRHKKRSKK